MTKIYEEKEPQIVRETGQVTPFGKVRGMIITEQTKPHMTQKQDKCCRFSHLSTTPCSEAWGNYVNSIGARKVLTLEAFKEVVCELFAADQISRNDDRRELDTEAGARRWFSYEPEKFGNRLYELTTIEHLERLGKALQYGLKRGWLKLNPLSMEYEVSNHDNTDLTGLMWQIALTNWETTKADLSTPQVAMMARLSLQALGLAVFPSNSRDYKPEEVEKALNKTKLVVSELNIRMQNEQRSRLPEPS